MSSAAIFTFRRVSRSAAPAPLPASRQRRRPRRLRRGHDSGRAARRLRVRRWQRRHAGACVIRNWRRHDAFVVRRVCSGSIAGGCVARVASSGIVVSAAARARPALPFGAARLPSATPFDVLADRPRVVVAIRRLRRQQLGDHRAQRERLRSASSGGGRPRDDQLFQPPRVRRLKRLLAA